MKPLKIILNAAVGMLLATQGIAAGGQHGHSDGSLMPPHFAKQLEFREAMRKLWEDHITWTRLFIVSAVADLPDKGATTTRLLQNQDDIGNAVKPFYGEAAGNQLATLLRDHILIAADLVAAAKAGNTAAVQAANQRWVANADQIAAFLSSANPRNWPLAEMRDMMHNHLDLTAREAVAQISGDFGGSITAYDEIHRQILNMADMLSQGIIRQFPARFR